MTKYPIYIVSKGRFKQPLTALLFKEFNMDFKVVVEPQEYDDYVKALGERYVLKLPFSNLGVGSYPARNFCFDHSKELGYKRHWVFDDNIWRFRRIVKGKKIPVNPEIAIKCLEDFIDRYTNIGVAGFNYSTFVVPGASDKKPFYLNVHCYSAMIMNNELPFRWRLKYNEDVDLCLQILHNKYCSILFNAFSVDKVSTSQKMEGGNQTELYQNNSHDKKVLKARSLDEMWKDEGYVKVIMRYGRPHHFVDWKSHFKHSLIKDPTFNWDELKKIDNYGMELKMLKKPKNKLLADFYKKETSN